MRVVAIALSLALGTSLPAQAPTDRLNEARSHLANGRLEEAVVSYRAFVIVDSTNAAAWRGLANALHRLEQYPEALQALDRAVAITPDDFAIRFNRGLTLSELGRFDDAVAELEAAQRLRSDFAPVWTELGAAKALAGRVSEARSDWTRALALDSSYIWSRFYRGLAAVATGDYRAAADDLDAVAARETLPSAHLWRWVANRLAGRGPPPLPVADQEWPAPIAAFLRGDLDEQGLEQAARDARMPLDDRRLASAWFFIGVKRLVDRKTDAAIFAFNRALAQNAPRHAELVAAAALGSRLGRR
jgi:tetratricopeptide (TPR) repeat protein